MPSKLVPYAAIGFALCAWTAWAETPPAVETPTRTPAPPEARVYISYPKNGKTVTNPFLVRFALSGMGVAPAGVERPSTGHHHLLIDVEDPPAPDKFIPADDQHRHFGGGQTEVRLSLPPGQHTLQLLLGDKNHIPHDPVVISEVITITVQDPPPPPAPEPPAPPPVEPAEPEPKEPVKQPSADTPPSSN